MRRLVTRDLGEARHTGDTSALFDLGETVGSDIATQKHRYIGDAVEAARR